MNPNDVEYNRGRRARLGSIRPTPPPRPVAQETIRRIEECGSWMVLKFIEKDEIYRALLHDVLAEVEPAIRATTGPMLKREGFIFISSPGSVTPFHFDPEHNILLQIRGRKTMTIFPAGDEGLRAPSSMSASTMAATATCPGRKPFPAAAARSS
jgi:hypothetical protein